MIEMHTHTHTHAHAHAHTHTHAGLPVGTSRNGKSIGAPLSEADVKHHGKTEF